MRAIEQAGYLAHSRGALFQRREDEALAIITAAISEHPGLWAVGCSGGKDSTTLLDLCCRAGWQGPVFHFTFAETPPENTSLVEAIAARYALLVHQVVVPGAWDVYAAVGHFYVHATTLDERQAANAMLHQYKQVASEAAESAGYTGLFWGLRSGESKTRSMMLAKKGPCYQVSDRIGWTCCPLLHWSARDVWAYLVAHDLPWLAWYDQSGNRERERSEITWLAAEGLWRYGQAQRLRIQDPALWNEMVQRFPDLARWG